MVRQKTRTERRAARRLAAPAFRALPVAAFFCIALFCADGRAFEAVRGANETLELAPDARTAGLGGVLLGLPGEAGASSWHPAGLSEAPGGWFALSHAEHFLDSRHDAFSFVVRPDGRDALGFSVARFGSDGVPRVGEDELPEGEEWETFDVSDWVATGAFARSWGRWRVGGSLHLLWRRLDQEGFGFQTDVSGGWVGESWRFEGALRNASGSGVVWESGWKEIEPPDLFLGAGWRRDIPYIYGELRIAWQSVGIFQEEGKSGVERSGSATDSSGKVDLAGGRAWEEPLEWLGSSSLAVEYVIAGKAALRAALPSVESPSEWSAGGGFRWKDFLRFDYAFRHHPELRSVHQVTLGINPWGL